ncbi:hypothetical protein Dimus_023018 [Dionaea muscipula]
MDSQVWDNKKAAASLGLSQISALAFVLRVFDSQSFNSSMASIFHDIVPSYHRASQVTSLPGKEISSIYEAISILTLQDIREMTLGFHLPITTNMAFQTLVAPPWTISTGRPYEFTWSTLLGVYVFLFPQF